MQSGSPLSPLLLNAKERLRKVIQTALLPRRHHRDGLHEVLVADLAALSSEGEHAGLDANGLELGAVEVLATAGQLLEHHVLPDVHLPAVDAHDLGSSLLGGVGQLDLAIQPSRTE